MVETERSLPMSKAILTAAILAGAGAYMAVNSPANALQVTGSILNPGAILTSNGNPGTQTLNFPTFTSANFPAAFAGLLPNQTLRLNNIQLTILGSPSGSFSVQNADTVNTVAVANNVYNMNIVANGATSTSSALLSNATTPNTPVATASTVPSTKIWVTKTCGGVHVG